MLRTRIPNTFIFGKSLGGVLNLHSSADLLIQLQPIPNLPMAMPMWSIEWIRGNVTWDGFSKDKA